VALVAPLRNAEVMTILPFLPILLGIWESLLAWMAEGRGQPIVETDGRRLKKV